MKRSRIKIVIAITLVVSALTYLAIAGVSEGWVYFLDVDTFNAGSQYHDQRVRLHGKVAQEDLEIHAGQMTAQFALIGAGKSEPLSVNYKGAIPDLFKADVDVVIEGKLDDSGTFQADTLMTKCASKYQSEEHAKQSGASL